MCALYGHDAPDTNRTTFFPGRSPVKALLVALAGEMVQMAPWRDRSSVRSMKLLDRRVCRVERAHTAQRRTHIFFRDTHETPDVVQARIRAKIASGQASPSDRFVTFFWRAPEDDG
jgi:hypothetical protein